MARFAAGQWMKIAQMGAPAYGGSKRRWLQNLSRLWGHAVPAHEHALVDHHLENAQCPGLVHPAFVATDRGHVGRVFEGRATFLALVAQTVCGDLGFLVVAHGTILDLS
jgi:hypothetical protein